MHGHTDRPDTVADDIIERTPFRKNIYTMIPEGASRVLDFGCGEGGLLLRLRRDKGCTELHGIEVDPSLTAPLEERIDGVRNLNLEHEAGPPPEYRGFFRYIIMHDVVEHLFDPWFTLTKIRAMLHPEGIVLLATPNLHYWQLQYQILSGFFPYGAGLWHTGHLRWYTPVSLLELLGIGGLQADLLYLEIPDTVDFAPLATGGPVTRFSIPPPEYRGLPDYPHTYTLEYDGDVRRYVPVFYAHKLLAVCTRARLFVASGPMTYQCPKLEAARRALGLPYDVFNPPPMRPLMGDWR